MQARPKYPHVYPCQFRLVVISRQHHPSTSYYCRRFLTKHNLPVAYLSPHSYANSVLQALYFCGPFRELLLQYPDPSVPDVPPPPPPLPIPPPLHPQQPSTSSRKRPVRSASVSDAAPSANPNAPPGAPIPAQPPTLLSALRSLLLHISRNPADKGTVAPRAFIDKLKELNELFRPSTHQDAHEFLNYVLNQIIEEMEADGQKPASQPTNGAERAAGEDRECCVSVLVRRSRTHAHAHSHVAVVGWYCTRIRSEHVNRDAVDAARGVHVAGHAVPLDDRAPPV